MNSWLDFRVGEGTEVSFGFIAADRSDGTHYQVPLTFPCDAESLAKALRLLNSVRDQPNSFVARKPPQ